MPGAQLEYALAELPTFDEGTDLVPYYKYLMALNGDKEYSIHFNEADVLSEAQRHYATTQYDLVRKWFANWSKEANA